MTDVNDSDIAIVGMAIRVPDAANPQQFWANLKSGVESVRHYTDEELLAKGVPASALADPNYVRAGIPLQDLDQFDPEFFGFSPKEAGILDPQHRQFYEVCWEALESAGHVPESFDGSIGLFGGCGMGAYFTFNLLTNPELVDNVGLFLLRHTGNDKDFLVTRVSYAFNLQGPSVNVQTACSTSLVATHMAVQSLLSGECDMALAGGVTIEVPHGVGYHYKEGEVLSPDGHCRTFDHRSKGTVFGSGAGVVVLRRLKDALRDGDKVHAVIKGSAVNNDGSRKVGYLAPSVDGQAACVSEALELADVSADTINYVECHGTATPVGDPIEIAALTQAFRASSDRKGYCLVGSVKTNIGHLDTAAGVSSLIKATLALENRLVPPSLNFEAPNPRLDFDSSPFRVAAQATEWARGDTPRRAGVNSLGVGGTNAFVVLEEAPERPPSPKDASPQPLMLSARNRKALDQNAQRLAAWLREHPEAELADVAFTLKAGRRAFEQRRVLAARDAAEAIALLETPDPRRVYTHTLEVEKPQLVFMFPGGGAQYVNMGRGLYEAEPVFREWIDRGLDILKTRFGADLRATLLPSGTPPATLGEALAVPSAQLPLTFLVEYALTQLWAHYGVKPDIVIGHSMGENTAACVAGVFSFEDALGLLLLRGQLMDDAPLGGMLSVQLPVAELRSRIGDELDVAAVNSPQMSVVSGAQDALDHLQAQLQGEGIDSQRIRVNVAAHSRLLDGILPRFRAYLQSIRLGEPKVRIVSNHTGGWLDPREARDPEYWVRHLRNTILFADGIDTMLRQDNLVFLEVGPGNILGALTRQNPRAPSQRVLSSMRHPDDESPDATYLRTAMGRLWALGVEFDTRKLWGKGRRRLALPTYAFQHARYWIDPGVGTSTAKADTQRPMKLPELAQWFRQPRWVQQGVIDRDATPRTWLAFAGRDAFGDALLAQLRSAGHRVIAVRPGDTFAQVDEHTYTLAAEAGGAGYQELIDALVARDLAPDRIAHAWLVTLDRGFRPGSTFFHRNQEHGFYSLFHLARALSKSGLADKGAHLVVLANGSQRVRDEALPFPDKATALGPCAVVPREFPALSCSFVDVDLGAAPEGRAARGAAHAPDTARLMADLADDLAALPANRVVAWRGGVRWQRLLGDSAPVSADAKPRLRDGGTYLITGGLGGIGGVIAEWLAREVKARLVLIGRTPLPQRSDWDDWLARHKADDSISRSIVKVRQLEALGAKVLPLSADVAVADSMKDALAEAHKAFGPVHGVLHAAGTIRDSLIALKSPRDIEDVFSAKIYGTLILDELFRDTPLDFMLLFSSTSAHIAPAGQVDYVGASAFVNAFAQSCRGQRRYPVTAIGWGIWKDVGMVGQVGAPAAPSAPADPVPAQAQARPATNPQFEQHYSSRDGTDQVHVFTGTLRSSDWVIDEHRLGSGEALLPGTGYLELVRAALAELGAAGPWHLHNLVFEAPMFVDDGGQRALRVVLRGDARHWDVEIHASSGDGFQRCAVARVDVGVPPAPADVALDEVQARCTGPATAAAGSGALRTRQEHHLRFGPRWQVLRRLQLGPREALARLQLAPQFAADLATHGLHPGLLDIATGCAMDLIPGYAEQEVAQNLWAPISYRGLRFHAPLQGEIVSWLRLASSGDAGSDFAAFDVTLTDPQGRVLAEVEQLTLRRLDGPWHAPRVATAPMGAEAGDGTGPRAKPMSPGEAALAHNVSQGIAPAEGLAALARLLAGELPAEAIVSSMRVEDLMAQAEGLSRATGAGSDAARFSRPELDSDFAPPRDAVEKTLAELWAKLLGVEGVGIRDSFFDLGGHSLIAVRLFNEIGDKFKVDLPMSVLMQSPTIEALATLVRGGPFVEGAEPGEGAAAEPAEKPAALRFRHVVPMQAGPSGGRTPLFVVAGMFGNVLNLSHLAHLLGEERPFYALQARGLYGDVAPHESFEEAAADYLAEIVQVQPQGPYLLGGFSGGGLIAYEMARQLIARGEKVLAVLMLDTPAREIPRFTLGDKLSMLVQDVQREGMKSLPGRIASRFAWEREKRLLSEQARMEEQDPKTSFQSHRIGEAFWRSLRAYRIPKLEVKVSLFRPRLDVKYRLRGGREVDGARNYVRSDNFWTSHVKILEVFEVPGTHDNMVLEPNVRVLVSLLKRAIDQL